VLLAALLGALPTVSPAANPVVADASRLVTSDAPAYFLAPGDWGGREWLGLGLLAVAATAASDTLDERVLDLVQDHRTASTRRLADLARGGGTPLGWGGGIVAATYLAGLVTGADGVRETGFEMAEAGILSGIVSAALRFAIGRSRPEADKGSTDFHPFEGGLTAGSMPSGHTTFAFALASVASVRVTGLGWVAYPLAALVGYSRINDDKHWTSDVVAGAVLGTVSGLWVTRRGRDAGQEPRLSVTPWLSDAGSGVCLSSRF
jgi:membrane-associated phospholipid phosphatase